MVTTADNIWTDREAVTGVYALKCLEYTDCITRTVAAAKQPDFDESGWDELAELLGCLLVHPGNVEPRR